MVTYHATFIPVLEHLLTRLCRALEPFIAANRPVIGGTQAPLFPGKEACFRAAKDGTIALLDIQSRISALQAKVIGRLLGQLTWKAFFAFWLYRSPTCYPRRDRQRWILVTSTSGSLADSCSSPHAKPRRHRRKYVESYQQLQPHRQSLLPHDDE